MSTSDATLKTFVPTAVADRATLWAVAFVTLAGGVLRFAWLDSQPLWYDEQLQVAAASAGDPWGLILAVISHSAAAPLDYLGTWYSLAVFDSPRVWPALVGTLTIPALFFAARAWYGERVALIAAVLLAFAPFHIYYSQEARYYALSALVAVLAFWAWKGRYFTLAVAACLYTFYFAFLVPLTLVVWYRRRFRELLWGVVAFLPWVLLALPAQIAQTYPQAAGLSTVPTPLLIAQLVTPDFEVSPFPALALLPLVIVAGLVAGGARRGLVPLALVVASVVLTGLATYALTYFWSPRQVTFALPFLLLVAALGADRLPRWALLAVLGLLVASWVPFIDGVTGADAWQPRTVTLQPPPSSEP